MPKFRITVTVVDTLEFDWTDFESKPPNTDVAIDELKEDTEVIDRVIQAGLTGDAESYNVEIEVVDQPTVGGPT